MTKIKMTGFFEGHTEYTKIAYNNCVLCTKTMHRFADSAKTDAKAVQKVLSV